jgi:hypothetical protein
VVPAQGKTREHHAFARIERIEHNHAERKKQKEQRKHEDDSGKREARRLKRASGMARRLGKQFFLYEKRHQRADGVKSHKKL